MYTYMKPLEILLMENGFNGQFQTIIFFFIYKMYIQKALIYLYNNVYSIFFIKRFKISNCSL